MIDISVTYNSVTYSFNYADQLIEFDNTVTTVNVVDLWEAIKRAQASFTGITYPVIATGSGRDNLNSGIRTFLTLTLQGLWSLKTAKTSGTFIVDGGNLLQANPHPIFFPNFDVVFQVQTSQAGVSINTGSGLSPEQSAQLKRLDDRMTGDSVLTETATGFTQTFDGVTYTVTKSGNIHTATRS